MKQISIPLRDSSRKFLEAILDLYAFKKYGFFYVDCKKDINEAIKKLSIEHDTNIPKNVLVLMFMEFLDNKEDLDLLFEKHGEILKDSNTKKESMISIPLKESSKRFLEAILDIYAFRKYGYFYVDCKKDINEAIKKLSIEHDTNIPKNVLVLMFMEFLPNKEDSELLLEKHKENFKTNG